MEYSQGDVDRILDQFSEPQALPKRFMDSWRYAIRRFLPKR